MKGVQPGAFFYPDNFLFCLLLLLAWNISGSHRFTERYPFTISNNAGRLALNLYISQTETAEFPAALRLPFAFFRFPFSVIRSPLSVIRYPLSVHPLPFALCPLPSPPADVNLKTSNDRTQTNHIS
jgi:hypothetical protein